MSYPFNRASLRIDPACPISHARPFGNSLPMQRYDLASAHLAAFGLNDTIFNFRAIHDREKGIAAIKRRGTLAQHWQELCALNNQGYGIFVTIAEMDGSGYDDAGFPIKDENGKTSFGDKKENVVNIRAHYADLDDLGAMENLKRAEFFMPPPQFWVQSSPNKAHVYWVLRERYCDNEWFSLHQAKVAEHFSGDHRITDPTRVMRLSGFYHHKGAPHLVTCQALAGYQFPTTRQELQGALSHVSVTPTGAGGKRRPLGDPELAAPSVELIESAFQCANPNIDRDDWIKFMFAIKQAAWSLMDEQEIQDRFMQWCERYHTNNPAENLKQWHDIKETEIGWKYIERQFPLVAFNRLSGNLPVSRNVTLPMPETQTSDKSFLDDGSGIPFDRLVSTEIYKIFRSTKLPIAWDGFIRKIVKRGAMPWKSTGREWTELDDAYAGAFLQGIRGREASSNALREAVLLVANKNAFNPVKDWLNATQWDGNARLDDLLTKYFSTDPAESEWARIVGPKFLIGMVARALDPGCKRDEILILQGPQGLFKSSALAILAGDEYFSDSLPNMHDKEASEHISSLWLIEVSEMAKILRGNQEDVKGFLARRTERYRPSYGKRSVTEPRQCVFAGTTNAEQYLNDPTGERRYWPVKCVGQIDLDGLRRDREQLFAEAVVRYRQGEPYWLTTTEEQSIAEKITSDRSEHDPWQDRIERHCAAFPLQSITMEHLFAACIGIPFDKQNSRETGRVARILTKLGYTRKQFRQTDGTRTWGYIKE